MGPDSIREIDGWLAVACSTGAIDPLEQMADYCEAEDIWLHVDASHGGFGVVNREGQAASRGNRACRGDTYWSIYWLNRSATTPSIKTKIMVTRPMIHPDAPSVLITINEMTNRPVRNPNIPSCFELHLCFAMLLASSSLCGTEKGTVLCSGCSFPLFCRRAGRITSLAEVLVPAPGTVILGLRKRKNPSTGQFAMSGMGPVTNSPGPEFRGWSTSRSPDPALM